MLLGIFAFVAMGITIAAVPSFDTNFAKYLTDKTPDAYGRVETVFSLCIDKDKSLMENIKNLFYPSAIVNPDSPCGNTQAGGQLWGLIRSLSVILLIVFIVLAGVNMIMKAKEADGTKKAITSLIYMAYGAFLIFGVIWILGTVLDLPNIQGTTQLVDRVQNGLFLQILSFFKVLGFFFAIIMMVVSGFKMMSAMDKADKLKAAKTGVMNIIIALVLIKVIDYVFYIAQIPEFGVKAKAMVSNVAIVLGWVLGAAFMAAVFYAGFLLLTSSGKEDNMKKATGLITNIVIVATVVFLFLLIVYQIFNEFV